MGNTVINTPELLNLDSTTGATVLAKGTVNERPATPTFSVDYLVVAGGGSAGAAGGGAGGGGGLRTSYGSTTGGGGSAESSLSLGLATNYNVTVGDGGAGVVHANPGNPGSNSVFSTITSIGGGFGGAYNTGHGGGTGGSGGGAGNSAASTSTFGAIASPTQGYVGGYKSVGSGAPNYVTAGGGGAGGPAGNVTQNTTPSDGGVGLAVNILNSTNAATASVGEVSGSDVYYAGGGGGASGTAGQPFGAGGLGGGTNGAAGCPGTAPLAGVANTGGGNGGTGGCPTAYSTGGGSGVVILRYPSVYSITVGSGITEASGSPFTEGSDKVSVFTAGTGTISFSGTVVGGDSDAIDGALRFNTETNKTEYFDGTGWYEIVDEYASGFVGPGTNYFDTKLYTGNGTTQSIGGYINGAGSFNGSSSIMTITDGGIGANGTARVSFSVSLWIKTTASNQSAIISDYGTNYGFYIQMESSASGGAGKLSIASYYTGGLIYTTAGTAAINDGDWHHLVLVNNTSDNTQKLYIDGNTTPVIDQTLGTGTKTANAIQVGYYTGYVGTYNFDGSIDQIRFYDTALSNSDVAALNLETATTATTATFPSGQTATATYTMDTSANGLLTTTDLSTVDYPSGAGCIALYEMNGNSNDTSNTYNGTPTNITYEGGAFDQAAVFNGSSGYINTNYTLTTDTTFSFSWWMNVEAPSSGNHYIVNDGNGTGHDGTFGIYHNASGQLGVFTGTNGGITGGLLTISGGVSGSWMHFAVSVDGTTATIYKNGSSQGTISVGSHTTAGILTLIIGRLGHYSGYYLNGDLDQVRIFNTALTQAQVTTLARGIATSYSGAATNVNFNGHLNFQPDLTWIKIRTLAYNHYLLDSVRGATEVLQSNLSDAESTQSTSLTSFDTNGFTVGSKLNVNANTEDFVAWNWKAGGAAVSNTDGTITSQVSANKDSGFSIATYTGVGYPNASTAEVGHGLTQAPDLVFIKGIGGTGQSGGAGSWVVGTGILASNNWAGSMYLNSTAAYYTAVNYFWNGAATDSVVKLKNDWFVNGTNNQYVMYSWHSVAGYSKIGTYTGDGTTSGKIITTGFEPSFLLTKPVGPSGGYWYILDNKRSTTNPRNDALFPNDALAEISSTNYNVDFLSTGFELKNNTIGFNENNEDYIYMAFA